MHDQGYVALWRKIQDHPFYKERRTFSKYEAWVDMLMEAQHSEKVEKIAIGMNVIECGYAQCVKSIRTWAKRWRWSDFKVRTFFKLLVRLEMIIVENLKKTSRITVCNYNKYDPKHLNNIAHPSHTHRTSIAHPSTDNNVNNEKNKKNVKEEVLSGKKNTVGKKFIPPLFEDVKEYIRDAKIKYVDPERFYNHYESIGWMKNGVQIKKWRPLVSNWSKRAQDNSKYEIKKNKDPLAYRYND